MASVILVYSTTDGHTRKICERLREVIERQQHAVEQHLGENRVVQVRAREWAVWQLALILKGEDQ